MTSRAIEDGVLMFSSAATAPSSCRKPSSFGSPPYPTVASRGSRSETFVARSAASIADPPRCIRFQAVVVISSRTNRLVLLVTTSG